VRLSVVLKYLYIVVVMLFLLQLVMCGGGSGSGDDDDDDDNDDDTEEAVSADDFCNLIVECDLLELLDYESVEDCVGSFDELEEATISCAALGQDCTELEECLTASGATDDDDDAIEELGLYWHFIPVEGSICRNGTPAGIGVRYYEGSKNLAIFLDGGGACVDLGNCLSTPGSFNEKDLEEMASEESWDLYSGIFNPVNDANPVKDWNFVYIPYCTGDMHMGNKPDSLIIGLLKRQQFVGFPNLKLFVKRIEEIFPSHKTDQVLVSGTSAGGFGSLVTYPLVAEAYPNSDVVLVNDSGPLLESNEAMSPCLIRAFRFRFGIEGSIPTDCPNCLMPDGDGAENLLPFLAQKYPNGRFGLFSALADRSIRGTFGPGKNSCLGLIGLSLYPLISKSVFRNALTGMRDDLLLPTGRWSTYYIESTSHGILPYEFIGQFSDELSFYETHYNGAFLTDWLAELLVQVPDPVGPDS
jgi:Pectinacetylesterase